MYLLTDRWFQLPDKVMEHPVQRNLFHSDKHQFKVVAAGRRSYKTERMKRRMIDNLLNTDHKGKRYFLGAPTRVQAKEIFWDDVKALIPKWAIVNPVKDIKESELSVKVSGNNTIVVVGLEEFQRIEGIRWDGCGVTEYQKVDGKFLTQTLQPILNDTGGEAILEGRPLGKNHFYDEFLREKTEPERWKSFHWTSEEILSPLQIQAAKNDLGLIDYQREYLASFETGGQRAYYAYEETNLKKIGIDYRLNLHLPIIVSCDFNATEKPMSWTVGQRQGELIYWFKSLSYQYTNTIKMSGILDDYLKTLESYPKIIYFYGDYSGTKLTSNSSVSDWQIIENYFKNKDGFKPLIEKKIKPTVSVRDRVAATNALLKNANDIRRMFADPRGCKALIRDWDRMSWKDNNVDLDESNDLDSHNAASVDYFSSYEYPVQEKSYSHQF